MAFCTECGATVPDGIKFCTECGKPIEEPAQPIPAMAAAEAQSPSFISAAPAAQPVRQAPPAQQPAYGYAAAPPVSQGNASADGKSDVISTGGYFLTLFLFSLPLIGWIACIILAFAANNRNRRNLARAMLIFLVIGLVLSVVMFFVMGWVWEAAMESVQSYGIGFPGGTPADLGSLNNLLDMLG